MHNIQTGADAIVMDDTDDVATLLRDAAAGEQITYYSKAKLATVQTVNAIQFGHKIAIKHIKQGMPVYKYGDIIGQATADIQVGEHVHVHNMEGIRGRGDQHKV